MIAVATLKLTLRVLTMTHDIKFINLTIAHDIKCIDNYSRTNGTIILG